MVNSFPQNQGESISTGMDSREDFAYYTNKQPAACDAGYVLSICYFVINALITIDSVKNK